MTEKRFDYEIDEIWDTDGITETVYVTDTESNWKFYVSSEMDADRLCKKLNEQQAIINKLQSDLKDYNEIKENWDDLVELATKTSLRNVELVEENARLQREMDDCEKFRYSVFKRIGEIER